MITTYKAMNQAIEEERTVGKLTRSRAIHYHCLDCVGYMPYSVSRCTNTHCPLWEYRTGKYTPLNRKADGE